MRKDHEEKMIIMSNVLEDTRVVTLESACICTIPSVHLAQLGRSQSAFCVYANEASMHELEVGSGGCHLK